MQKNISKIKFVRRFVPYFIEITKPLQKMIKKYFHFKGKYVENESFGNINATIVIAPSL
jgi:hypothetical protein